MFSAVALCSINCTPLSRNWDSTFSFVKEYGFNFFLCQGLGKSLFFTVKDYGYIIGSTTLRNKETTTCGSSKITQRKEKGEKENLIKERAEKEKAHSNTQVFEGDFKRRKKK